MRLTARRSSHAPHGAHGSTQRSCMQAVRCRPGFAFGANGPNFGRRRQAQAGFVGLRNSAVTTSSCSLYKQHAHSTYPGTAASAQLRSRSLPAKAPASLGAANSATGQQEGVRQQQARRSVVAQAGIVTTPGMSDATKEGTVVDTLNAIPLVSLVVPEAGVQGVDALIVGGGPSGLAAALLLHKRGWERIVVLEQQDSVTKADITKSYVYSIDGRGRKALDMFNLTDKIMQAGADFKDLLVVPAKGPAKSSTLVIRDPTRRSSWMPRATFLEILYSAVQAAGPAIQVVTGATCTFVGRAAGDANGPLRVEAKAGGSLYKYDPRLLIGADGVQSVVREQLQEWSPKQDKFKMHKVHSPAAGLRIKVLVVPPNPTAKDSTGKTVVMTNNSACVAAGHNGLRLGMLPIKDVDRPRTANVILKPDNPFWNIKDPNQLLTHFESSFPQLPIRDMISEEQAAAFVASPGTTFPRPQYCPSMQVVVRSDPRWGEERAKLTDAPIQVPSANPENERVQGVLLLGDAVHCFPPDLGQGVNSALEDIWVLDQVLAECNNKVETALPAFEQRRLPDVKALVRLMQFGYPYQYNQDPIGKALWTANFVSRLGLSKVLPFLIAPPAFMMVQDPSLRYSEILARAERTTRLLVVFVGIAVLALLYAFYGGRPAL